MEKHKSLSEARERLEANGDRQSLKLYREALVEAGAQDTITVGPDGRVGNDNANTRGYTFADGGDSVSPERSGVACLVRNDSGEIHGFDGRAAAVTVEGGLVFAENGEIKPGKDGFSYIAPDGTGFEDPAEALREIRENANASGIGNLSLPQDDNRQVMDLGGGAAIVHFERGGDSVSAPSERGKLYRDPAEGPAIDYGDPARDRYTAEPGVMLNPGERPATLEAEAPSM